MFFPDFLVCPRRAWIIYLFFVLSIERLLNFHLTSELNIPDLSSLLFNTNTHILTNKATPRQGRGAGSISNTPEIPDILIPWDLLSYLLWESEFMMSKLGSFICVPGGCNMRPRWLDLLITGSSMPHFKEKESPRHATSEN